MLLVFVHGWSVTHTDTYGELPEALQAAAPAALAIDIRHIHLGRYISFHDEVRMADLTRAFDAAIREQIPGNTDASQPFACITHSTGGPVIRAWLERYYGASGLNRLPLRHLVMLAPANHGSALAQLGKGRLSRMKAWFQGIEPGQGVLDWLELGSREQVELNLRSLDYASADHGFYPFVFSGQTIDAKLYDHLNSYTGETGSDGVVRLAAANLNFRYVRMEQTENVVRQRPLTFELAPVAPPRASPQTGFGVIPGTAHSGKSIGIMRSVTVENHDQKPVIAEILRCLQVGTASDYAQACTALTMLTENTQKDEDMARCAMVIWRLVDTNGVLITDYDVVLLAGATYSPDRLPDGFFVDRQKNRLSPNTLTYYLNYDKIRTISGGRIGFRVTARPDTGFAYYCAGEFRSGDLPLDALLCANQTLIVDIVLKRRVDRETFRLDGVDTTGTIPRRDFTGVRPSGVEVP